MGSDVTLEAEVRVLEEDAGAEETGTADGDLVQGRPSGGGGGGGGEEIGGERTGAAGAVADVANEVGEAGRDAGEAGPVAGIDLELGEDVEDDVVGEERERGRGSA